MAHTVKHTRRHYEKRLKILLLLLILLPTFAVYYQLAGHEFVSLDDSLYVSGNQRVQSGISLDNVVWAFQTLQAEFWHPLTWLSYMLDTEIYGTGPGGYLLTNLLLHLINSTLVLFCFFRFTGRVWESWLIALIFALHPLHVEPVAWVSGRKELLCACFWLLSLLAYDGYRRYPGWQRYFPVVIFFAMGLMAKSMIVTLPLVLLLLDYWPLGRGNEGEAAVHEGKKAVRYWRPLVIEKIPLLAISLAGIIITVIAQQRGGGLVSTASLPVLSRISHVLIAYVVYLKQTLWPGSMTPLSPPPAFISSGMAAAAFFVLLAITVVVVGRARRQPYLFTGWFWFLGTLVPVIGIVKVGDFFIADRYMYMPLTGILIMMVFSLKALINRLSHQLPWLIIIPIIVAGVYAPATFFQIQTWRNSKTLYTYALAVTEKNFLAHHALGDLLASRNDRTGAIDHFSKAVAIRPDKAILWVDLGRALVFDGRWRPAGEAFKQAAQLKPEHPAPRFYLGCARAAGGESAQALSFLVECLQRLRPQDPPIHSLYLEVMDFYEKALYYERQDQLPTAAQYYTKALAVMNMDVPRRQLRRLVVGGYDQWLAQISTFKKEATIEGNHSADD